MKFREQSLKMADWNIMDIAKNSAQCIALYTVLVSIQCMLSLAISEYENTLLSLQQMF